MPSIDPEGPAFKNRISKDSSSSEPSASKPEPSASKSGFIPPEEGIQETANSRNSLRGKIKEAVGDVRKIALLLPLSGPRELIGYELLNAAQMAIFDLADENFVVLIFDTRGTDAGAAAAASEAVSSGAGLILGPLLATSIKAVRPIATRAGQAVLAFSNSWQAAGRGVYILGFVPRQQVEAVVNYAVAEGLYRFAALAPDNAYGRAVVKALKDSVEVHDAVLVKTAYYDPSTTDFAPIAKEIANYDQRHKALITQKAELGSRGDEVSKQVLKRLEKLDTIGEVDYEAILLPGGGQQLKTIASLLSYYDVDQPSVRLLGLSNWAQTANIESEPSLTLGWYAAPPREEREAFFQRYRELYGRVPAAIASLAYDATALAIVLGKAGASGKVTQGQLIQSQGFFGVDGLFRLRSEGVAERVFEIREVTQRGVRVLRPAPKAFP